MFANYDLQKLICIFPDYIKKGINSQSEPNRIIEIVLDLGRKPELRFLTKNEYISQKVVSWQDIDYLITQIGKVADDNRAGINETLHRISCIKNKKGIIIGVTCRVGKFIIGTVGLIEDLIHREQSVLLLGKPGVGKTTAIRELARVFSDELLKRVVIVDTSNEIAGDSDIPHIGIGKARRLHVFQSNFQHKVMIEAVENHMPEIIVVDEIGTELESYAARTIAERGVQLIGTAHGNSLENLIKNPALSELIGGIEVVTLSDNEAKRRGTQKSILERKGLSAFKIAIEMNSVTNWRIHTNVEASVDFILLRRIPFLEFRKINLTKKVSIFYRASEFVFNFGNTQKQTDSVKDIFFSQEKKTLIDDLININKTQLFLRKFQLQKNFIQTNIFTPFGSIKFPMSKQAYKSLTIFCFSVSAEKVNTILKQLNLNFKITGQVTNADIIISQSYQLLKSKSFCKILKHRKIPTLLIKNTKLNFLRVYFITFINL